MRREYAFAKAVRYCGGLKKLAKKIGEKYTTLLYQRNHAKQVDLRIALKIEIATNYTVRWYELTEEKDRDMIERLEKGLPSKMSDELLKKPEKCLSERVHEAMILEKAHYGNRQGQRSDQHFVINSDEVDSKAGQSKILKTSKAVKGRTDEAVAKKFGFNRTEYRDAKTVLLKGVPELIQAMDEGLKPYRAVKLTRYSREKQRWILSLSREEIMTYTNTTSKRQNKGNKANESQQKRIHHELPAEVI
jgi:hypothetical protein